MNKIKRTINKRVLMCLIGVVCFSMNTFSAFAATDTNIKLNSDVLRQIANSGEDGMVKVGDLFIGIGDEGVTVNELDNCLNQYGLPYEWGPCSESDDGFLMGNMEIRVDVNLYAECDENYEKQSNWLYEQMYEWMDENYDMERTYTDYEYYNECWNSTSFKEKEAQYSESLLQLERQVHFPKEIEFGVVFLPDYFNENMEFVPYPSNTTYDLIEHIETINNSKSTN